MNQGASPLVSVVTPFYNTAEYLAECIESVLGQSYQRFEYILANNCSTDGSAEIARKYAAQDARIKIYDNEEFLGQLPNYNKALRRISPDSKYCKVVLADDWIFPNCLTEMLSVGEQYPSVGIVASYLLKGREVEGVGLNYPSLFVSGRDICRKQLLEGRFFFGSPTSILMRSEMVRSRDPFYGESTLHGDTEACYELLETWDFGFVHQVLSFTRTDNESITSKVASFNPHILDKLIVVKKFGPMYLTDEEYRQCWNGIESRYLKYLGESLLRRRGGSFWDYHRSGMQTIGYHAALGKLALYGVLAAADLLLHPKNTVLGLHARYRRKARARRTVGAARD